MVQNENLFQVSSYFATLKPFPVSAVFYSVSAAQAPHSPSPFFLKDSQNPDMVLAVSGFPQSSSHPSIRFVLAPLLQER